MADINSSLIGYLKKKSLFNTSPIKNKQQRSLSRDEKKFDLSQKSHKKISYNPQNRNVVEPEFTYPTKNLNKHSSTQQFVDFNLDSVSQVSHPIQSPGRYQRNSPQQQKPKLTKRQFNFQPKQQQPQIERQEPKQRAWNLMAKVITFQSARLESAQCLDNMIVKLQTEISSINYKVDAFRSKMSQILDEQFANLREKINYMVEKVIQESQNNIKIYIKQQEKSLAADLVIMRQNLMKEYQKIQVMKEQINKPNWRKVAGELLSSELEEKVQQMLVKAKSMSVRPWQLKDLGDDKLPALERQLRNVFKLS